MELSTSGQFILIDLRSGISIGTFRSPQELIESRLYPLGPQSESIEAGIEYLNTLASEIIPRVIQTLKEDFEIDA